VAGFSGIRKQIARATTIMGGASIFTIALRILKTKALAVLNGPVGIGLMGMCALLVDLLRGSLFATHTLSLSQTLVV
jgi:hypothetical protein